jgi:MFS transporter, PAT family, solute carrier family 33 (acetyl-CoA transportor), member 1
VFLAFNSAEFANTYIRSTPSPEGIVSLGGYLQFWGIMFLLCNFALLIFKTYDPVEQEDGIMETYQTIWDICKLPHMKSFIIVMLIAKIGFQANEAVTGLKLLELGFNKEYLALSVLIDFPLQMIFGYYAAKWSSGPTPLYPWTIGFYGRLFAALGGMLVVYNFPKEGVTTLYFILVMSATVLTSFMK